MWNNCTALQQHIITLFCIKATEVTENRGTVCITGDASCEKVPLPHFSGRKGCLALLRDPVVPCSGPQCLTAVVPFAKEQCQAFATFTIDGPFAGALQRP